MRSASYLREFSFGNGQIGLYYALPLLEQQGFGAISRLPVSLRIMLESLLRHVDGQYVSEAHLRQLAATSTTRDGNSVRGGAHSAAGLHRCAPAM